MPGTELTTRRLCEWNNTRAEVTIRINSARTDVAGYLDLLDKQGIKAVPHAFAPGHFLALPHGARVCDLPGYADGWFSVQDPSTAVAVDLLDPQPGEAVVDACAAPGGKTTIIAERMGGTGSIVALDSRDDRTPQLRENMDRMASGCVTILCADATSPGSVLGLRRFDRILVDAPCTNTGVLRRRPDARWRITVKRLKEMRQLQRSILDGVAPFLKKGGTLVYSTCSLEPEECNGVVSEWLSGRPNFALEKEVSLFPPVSGTDGIYAAALKLEV